MLRKQRFNSSNIFITNGWTVTQPISTKINKLFFKICFLSYITLTKNLSVVLRTCPHKWWLRHFIMFSSNSQTFHHIANLMTHFTKASFSTTSIYRIANIRATGCINTLFTKCLETGKKKRPVGFRFILSTRISFGIRHIWVWIFPLKLASCGFGPQLSFSKHQFSYLTGGYWYLIYRVL